MFKPYLKIILRSGISLRSKKYHFNCLASSCHCPKKACIILAPGAEEMEFTITTDVLRRGEIDVTIAGLQGMCPVRCSRNVIIMPEVSLAEVAKKTFDVIILPGGLDGSQALAQSKMVGEILRKQEQDQRYIACICAAPISLLAHRVHMSKRITSFPGVKEQLAKYYEYIEGPTVVQDGFLITSRGPGTAFDFALKLVELLAGSYKADSIAKHMLLKYSSC